MNLHATMLGKKLLDQFCLVAAHVVADDVDRLARRLRCHDVAEEGHTFGLQARSLALFRRV